MDRLSRNTELQSRKEQATARGVGVMTQVFAARAENAEIFDVCLLYTSPSPRD